LDVKAFDTFGNPIDGSAAKARISTPEGNSFEVPLTQRGPGAYEGNFAVSELGSYVVTIAEADGRGVTNSGFSVPYPPEYKRYRANTALLERMSASTGGMALTTPVQAARPMANPGTSISPLWNILIALAALLLPFDVAARRLALPLTAIVSRMARLFSRRPVRERVTNVDPRVERLMGAKERAQKPTQEPKPETTQTTSKTEANAPTSAATKLLEAKRRRDE
jgi:hypothetical protein